MGTHNKEEERRIKSKETADAFIRVFESLTPERKNYIRQQCRKTLKRQGERMFNNLMAYYKQS